MREQDWGTVQSVTTEGRMKEEQLGWHAGCKKKKMQALNSDLGVTFRITLQNSQKTQNDKGQGGVMVE